jgi:hypothetical protein
VLFLAVQPDRETLLNVHGHLGVGIPCRAVIPHTHATLLKGGDNQAFVVIVNMGEGETAVVVRIEKEHLPWKTPLATDLSTGAGVDIVDKGGHATMYVPVGRKDGTVIGITG